MRIVKYIAACGVCSRRAAKDVIGQGRVRLNGHIVFDLNLQVRPGKDRVQVDKREIQLKPKQYFLFYKPQKVICSRKDRLDRPTVYAYLPSEHLYIGGRLDYNSEGLLVVSNDGDFIHLLTHPAHEIQKTYRVKVRGVIQHGRFARMPGKVRTARETYQVDEVADIVHTRSNTWFNMVIHEGKNHEVRNIVQHFGLSVVRLIRLSVGPFCLADLRPGELKAIDKELIRRFKETYGSKS